MIRAADNDNMMMIRAADNGNMVMIRARDGCEWSLAIG
jgi:hypothetical protein